MDPVIAPIGSAVLITAAAIGSVFGAGSSGDAAADKVADKVADIVRGLLGNWASNGFQAGTLKLLEHAADQSIDPATGLPRNHDIQLASADAMRGAAIALLLELGRTLKPKAPWLPALQNFIFTQRKLGKEPLINAFQRDDLAAVASLRSEIESPRFREWHDSLRLNEQEIRSCFVGGVCSLRPVLRHRFAEWARRHLEQDDAQRALDKLLEEGWSAGGRQVLRFEDIYCLHFREFLKHRPEVFRIVVTDTLMATDQHVRAIGEALEAHIGAVQGLFEQQRALIDLVGQGQRELSKTLGDVLTTLSVLQVQQHSDAEGTAQVLHALKDHAQRLSEAFRRLEQSLFGLPLVRPEATAPPPASQGDLWVIRAKHRAVPLIGRDSVMSDLWTWLHDSATCSVRLLTGGAGAGKTRLAYELVWRTAREFGDEWNAGRIEGAQIRRLTCTTDAADWVWDRPTLAVIDYARAATDGLKLLLKELARRGSGFCGPKFRLLLLERTATATAEWVSDLLRVEASDGGYPAASMFDPPRAVELPRVDSAIERRAIFAAALAAVAGPAPPLTTPSLGALPEFDRMINQPEWGDPLVPAMAALVFRQKRDWHSTAGLSRIDLAEYLARIEAERVCKFAQLGSMPSEQEPILQVAALVTVCGGLNFAKALELAGLHSTAMQWSLPNGTRGLVSCLHRAWSGPDGAVSRLSPDIVAEAFVLSILCRDSTSFKDGVDAVVRAAPLDPVNATDIVLRALQNFAQHFRWESWLRACLAALEAGGFVVRAIQVLGDPTAATRYGISKVQEMFERCAGGPLSPNIREQAIAASAWIYAEQRIDAPAFGWGKAY